MILDEPLITSALAISWIVFASVSAGVLLGLLLRAVLPEHHLGTESKDVVKLGMGLIATMSALVLSLLIASAKSSYDVQRSNVVQMSTNVILLDRVMAHYGPEARQARELLRSAVGQALERVWPTSHARPAQLAPTSGPERFYDEIHALAPRDETQRSLKREALRLGIDIGRTRWLLLEQRGSSIPFPFMAVLTFWLAMIFMSFAIFAPVNTTVIATLLICALSISGAIFLILELDTPFGGLIQISSAPLQDALAHLGQ
ncbi:MAG: hypothetical protein DMD91_31385 [Candidatus Rokuibacteriota bacterium]|nr:MAG: hypothetical protein DMD91_31385 [Candidatus Rokubacteria bacterium]